MTTIHDTFSAVTRAFPDRPAIICGDQRLTYAELHDRGLRVAGGLRAGLEPEEVVGLCAGRSPEAVAGKLGILHAGGAYLPLDPRLPDARLRHLAADSGIRRVLIDLAGADRIHALALPGVEVAVIDDLLACAPLRQGRRSSGSRLAYVLYTSGSTGRPKGVMVEHRSVVALARNRFFSVRRDDVFCQLAPLHADPSVFETWAPLLGGATLTLPPDRDLSVDEIRAVVVRHGVTVLRLVAPLFNLVVEAGTEPLRGLRMLISGGDRASESAVRAALADLPGCTVVNGYGPTESTVYACCHPMTSYDESWPSVPIGGPIDGVTAQVLDDGLRPSGSGELYLGGTPLPRGYLNLPELTRERFITDPRTGERMYRTGDRVRRLGDGNLEFLGRVDDQVKVRGFRVEPGEVEAALTGHEAVTEAAVVARANRLEAFVTVRDGAEPADLPAYLAERLPEYMVPALIEPVAALPRLPGGKVDRSALTVRGPRRPDHREPGTETERRLAAIWADVLGWERVGLDDSFFDLGGHSLAAMEITARVSRELGAWLPVAAVFEASTVGTLASRVDAAERERNASATRAGTATRAPLTAGQAGVWFDDQLADTGRYTIARTFDLEGPVDESALRAALDALADRHHVLKTVVESDDGGLWQVVRDDRRPALRCVDLSSVPATEREARASALVGQAVADRIELSEGPLARVLLVRLGESRSVLHLEVHHIAADDWSLDILFGELSALYEAQLRGTPAELPPLAAQYADHAEWDRAFEPDRRAAAIPTWQRLLDGYPGTIDLPSDRAPSNLPSGRGDRIRVELDPELVAAVRRLARQHEVSRFMVTLAAVYLVLGQHARQRDICVGIPFAGRGRPGTESLIGYFVNMLAVRIHPDGQPTVAELLQHVRDTCLQAYRHQDVPFQSLVRELGVAGTSGRFPLFQVVVGYQQRPPRPLSLAGVTVTQREVVSDSAKFDLGFGFTEHGDGLRVEIEFSTDVFARESVEYIGEHLVNTFRWLADHPTTSLDGLVMLSPAEEHLVRVEWNRTEQDFPDRCLHELVSERALDRLDKPAVVGPDGTLTYRELEERSDRLAALLAHQGVGRGDRVAVCLDRSARLIVAILGVLKAGAVYVPLDPSYPAERLALIASDARAGALITAGDHRGRLPDPDSAGAPTAVIDLGRPLPDVPPELADPPRPPAPDDLAYIIYTSGSTGRPKGVAVEHHAVLNMLYSHLRLGWFTESDVWSQFAAAGFDMAIYEQFMPLLTGGTSVICPEDLKLDGRLFVDFINRNRVTVMVVAPTFLRSLDQPELPTVRYVLTGGEAAHMTDVRHYAQTKTYVNGYGPTETVIVATTYVADGSEAGSRLPIGKPLPNSTVYILDDHGRLAPVGVPGEVYVGGPALARGYWDDPELTREKFAPVPVLGEERVYRSGDRARWLPDGNLDFLGRLNDQVKLRGYRVELGEVETALARHPAVAQAAVLEYQQTLVAFVVGAASPAELRGYLGERLPGFMVPGAFVRVDQMPVTEHSKIDRGALARLAAGAHSGGSAAEAPRTPTEERMAGLWGDVLDVPEPGMDTDFFALGGYSLLIVRLLDQVEAEFGARIGVREFLAAPTVRGLAARLDGTSGGSALEAVEEADARLDPGLRFPAVTAPAGERGAVLLTGATGFVGAFLLRELLRRTDAKIRCLVRAPSPDAARTRLQEVADTYRLGLDPDDPRVVAVPGDLGEPGLGLDPALRGSLAESTDMIVHAGAHVHHLSSYARLKRPNVDGTHELVRLAAEGRPKRLHHVSSLSVFTGADDRAITEDSGTAQERHSPGRGYSASKWVADRMIGHAAERGVACCIYRLGRISGATDTGVASVDDIFYRLLISCAALRCYPDDPALDTNLLPVDVAAQALIALALGGDERVVYHLHHRDGTGLADFMAVFDRLRGGESEPVPLGEWVNRVRRSGRDLPIQPYLPALAEPAAPGAGQPAIEYSNEVTRSRLARLGVTIPDLNTALIERYWHFLAEGGFLP